MNQSKQTRIALAGFGTVGQALLDLLARQRERHENVLGRELRVVSLLDRSFEKKKHMIPSGVSATQSVEEFLSQPADIFVELVGGLETAAEIVAGALQRGRSVVTANKALIARRGAEFLELAAQRNASLSFEASVAGGIPILRTLQESLSADEILEVRGILNGTCNYILTDMGARRSSFEESLAGAQALGYAEADPKLDLSGQDAAEKLAILAALAFGVWPSLSGFPVRGITELESIDFDYAEQLGGVWRLLGWARRREDQLTLLVSPFLVDRNLPLAAVAGAQNAIELSAHHLGNLFLAGPGAGGHPTATAVAADLLQAVRGLLQQSPQTTRKMPVLEKCEGDEVYHFYIRFTVQDQPGIIAQVAGILAHLQINIDSVYQQRWRDRDQLPFVITTDPAPWSRMQEALQQMGELTFNRIPPFCVPILRHSRNG